MMAFAGSMDMLTMTIPNRVSLILIAAFLIAAPVTGMTMEQFGWHLASFGLILSCTIAMFALGWMGGGDAKLIAVGALWVGFETLPLFLTNIAVFGGLLAVFILGFRAIPITGLPLPNWAHRLHQSGGGIPYGLAIAGAALLVYPHTIWFGSLGS